MLKHAVIGALAMAVGCVAVGTMAYGDDKSDAQAAIQKLGASANYSWSATQAAPAAGARGGRGGRGRGGPAAGKSEPAGYTTFTLTNQNGSYDVVIKGDKAVVKMEDGWKTTAELQKAADDAGGGFTPETFLILTVQNFKSPAAQAKEISDKFTNVKKADDGYTADLAEDTAKSMLTFRFPGGGANAPQMDISGAKGTLHIWTKDGMMNKMEVHLEGTVSFNGNDIQRNQTTTTEITDIGTTKVTVPDEAKKKLDAAAKP